MESNENSFVIKDSVAQFSSASQTLDTFSLVENYADPFLKKLVVEKNADAPHKKIVIKKQEQPKGEVKWPMIIYEGEIKNQKSSKQLVMVKISGQDNLMKAGDAAEEVSLLSVYKDSIHVSYKNEKKTIKK